MELAKLIRRLNAADGPNINITTMAIYCGVNHSTLSRLKNAKAGVSPELEKRIRKGLHEMLAEIEELITDGDNE